MLERGIKECALSASISLNLEMEGMDPSQDPDMILHPDIIRIIDQDMTDSNFLEEEENWISVIDRNHIQGLHILHDA